MPRAASEFQSRQKITISLFPPLFNDKEVSAEAIAGVIERGYADSYSVKVQHRKPRSGTADPNKSTTIFLAPKGYQFETGAKSKGRRFTADEMAVLAQTASKLGISADDPDFVSKLAKAIK